jgi:glycosyltransferase involved in cell wall biosynthesis
VDVPKNSQVVTPDNRRFPPRVCVDGFNIALPKGSGVATYGRNLIAALSTTGRSVSVLYGPASAYQADPVADTAAIADLPPPRSRINKRERWRRTLLSRFGRVADPVLLSDQIVWSFENQGRPPVDIGWTARDLYTISNRAFQKYGTVTPISFRQGDHLQPDVVHWTCPLPLYAKKAANLLTVHDLIPLRLPHTTTDDTSTYFRLVRTAIDRADHVIVVSERTKQDLVEMMGVDERRITNTYQAVSLPPELAERSDSDVCLDVEETLGLGWQEYFLYFGAVEPKKNLGRLIEAHLASQVSAPLVIVGGRGWLDEDENAFLDQIAALPDLRSDRVRRYPYMPFRLLISLIRGARGVVFPSLYEGFGLPVLEAMLLGAPVITSTAGSLPEVAGDAALSIDPYDVDAIRKAIRLIDSDSGLRKDLRLRGRMQANKFNPEAYALAVAGAYRKLGF